VVDPCVVDQFYGRPVCGRPGSSGRPARVWSTFVFSSRPVCGRPVLFMVDLCMWSTWLERRTGRGLMGVQLPVLTSQPGSNLLRGG